MAALVDYSIDGLSDYLTRGYWDHYGHYYHSFNMSGSGVGANNRTLYYNFTGFSDIPGAGTDVDGLTFGRRALVDTALDYLGDVLGINFVQTISQGDEVDLFFKDNDSGAYCNYNYYTNYGNGQSGHRYTVNSWVNVAADFDFGSSEVGGLSYLVIVHEILHALGLGHPGPYNYTGSPDWQSVFVTDSNDAVPDGSNIALNDSWQTTIQSYFDQDENTVVDASFAFLITPMAADLEALRSLYGSSSAFTGNDVYGFNTNVGGVLSDLAAYADENAFTIIDDGGNDTLDFSGYGANQKIDLTVVSGSSTGIFSDIGGLKGNMSLAVGTLIENAVGGSGNDEIIGNDADNTLTGNAGNDRFHGKGGADRIDGGQGIDTVVYDGVRADYQQDLQVDGTILLTKSGAIIDLLFGIERLDLADGDYIFDIESDNVGFAYRLYGAGYGRTPDEVGLRYWTGVLDSMDINNPGADKRDFLADQFLAADEFIALYGANPSNEQYIDAMYQNVLKRMPDQVGYDYWVGAMQNGLGRDAILVHFADSIENRINADFDYDDGIWVT